MKKALYILILLLIIASSLTAGTLAMYTTTIDDLAQGSVVAKEFIFTNEGTDSFAQNVKIAPGGTVSWQFYVKNYSGYIVTETDLYYKLTFNVQASEGKTAIVPITVTVKDENGNTVGSAAGAGIFDVLDEFPLSETGQEDLYTVEVYWPSGDNDIDYAGGDYGSSVYISAVGSQVPLSGGGPTESPTPTPTPTPTPQPIDISVLYQTTAAWPSGGNYRFNYRFTITNNSDQPIENWYIRFILSQNELTGAWDAVMTTGLPVGTYEFVNPSYNNPSTDSIAPGASVTFSGQGLGNGQEAPQNVQVGGSNAALTDAEITCEFGSL